VSSNSSLNQQIHPIADFNDRVVSFVEGVDVASGQSSTRSEIQSVAPIAKFEDRVESSSSAALEVTIDSDLAPYFPTAESVNDALRALVAIARRNGAA
jgi:hypothetical protein